MVTFKPNQKLLTRAGGFSSAGGRANNQDCFGTFELSADPSKGPDLGALFVVADGMGGHGGGDRASHMAVERIGRSLLGRLETNGVSALLRSVPNGAVPHIDAGPILESAFLEIDGAMQAVGRSDPRFMDMGTTLTAAWILGNRLFYGHAGDSRLYRKRAGGFDQVTEDQNVAYRLWCEGRLTDEEYRESPYRSVLLSYVGGGKIDVQTGSNPVESGDRLLLATDGLIEQTSAGELEEMLSVCETPDACAEKLVCLADVRGAKDNVTALVVFIDSE